MGRNDEVVLKDYSPCKYQGGFEEEKACDLENMFNVDYENQTAVMKDNFMKASDLRRAKKDTSLANENGWKVIDKCLAPSKARLAQESWAAIRFFKRYTRAYMQKTAALESVHTGEQAFEKTLHGRMTQHFYETRYAAPFSSVGKNWQGMSHLYHSIKQNSIGNYKDMVKAMFEDKTLRGSLNQQPIESEQAALGRRCNNKNE